MNTEKTLNTGKRGILENEARTLENIDYWKTMNTGKQ